MPPRKKAFLPGQAVLLAPPPMAPGLALGIDEAGRGCLAGPVVAGAVLLPSPCPIEGLADSKTLSAPQRDVLATAIKGQALAWGVGVVWHKRIDEINILQATFEAMSRAAACLAQRHVRRHGTPLPACFLHIDGNKTIPPAVLAARWPLPALPPQVALVKGDALEGHIGAASILAKTFRDAIMSCLHKRWPVYNFAGHKGYGTKEHLAALAAHGPCPLHRLTFGGVLPDGKIKGRPGRSLSQGRLL